MNGFLCTLCHQHHDELPLSYGSHAPDAWYAVPEKQRRKRSVLSSDQCIIDNTQFFLVGNIDIPIIGSNDIFSWTVWVSVSALNFERANALWTTPERESEPPFFAWLNTALPYSPTTINLKTNVHTRPVGRRPQIELEPTDHPLAIEQRHGITRQRIQEIAENILHGN